MMRAHNPDGDVRALVPIRAGRVVVGVRDTVTGQLYWSQCDECGDWLDDDALAGGHDCEL